MLRLIVLCATLTVAALGDISASARQTPQNSLRGAWLLSEVVTGPGSPNAAPLPSLSVFTDRHYSSMAIIGTRPKFAPGQATDAQKLATYDAFAGHSGTYEVSGTTVTTWVGGMSGVGGSGLQDVPASGSSFPKQYTSGVSDGLGIIVGLGVRVGVGHVRAITVSTRLSCVGVGKDPLPELRTVAGVTGDHVRILKPISDETESIVTSAHHCSHFTVCPDAAQSPLDRSLPRRSIRF